MYHGGNENDIHSGLIGPIVIVSPKYITTINGMKYALPCDVDFEFFVAMISFDETSSWYKTSFFLYISFILCRYFAQNMRSKYGDLSDDEISEYSSDSNWVTANIRHTINGYMYGNLNENNGMSLSLNSIVRWNILSVADTSTDIITWEHNTVKDSTGHNSDYCSISTPGYSSVDMIPSSVGISMLFYNMNYDKQSSGMIAMYAVIDDDYKSNDNNDDSSLGVSHSTRSFFIVVIVFSVIGVVGLLFYSASTTTSPGSDMSPILLESSHHVINPVRRDSAPSMEMKSISAQSTSSPVDNSIALSEQQGSSPSKVIYHVKHAEI